MRRVLSGCVVAAAVVCSVAGAADAQADEAARSAALVNRERAAASVRPADDHVGLERIAARHAARMAQAGTIFHNDRLGEEADAEGIEWNRLGENVGAGRDAEQMHDAFMTSETHRANILQPQFNSVAVGTAIGEDDRLYLVQVYGDVRAARAPKSRQVAPTLRTAPPARKPVARSVQAAVAPTPTPRAASSEFTTADPRNSSGPNALTGGIVAL